jgi:hypothetical protein
VTCLNRSARALSLLALTTILLLAVLPIRAASAAGLAPFAPYVDMTLYDDPGLPAVQRATGAHLLSLGFVIGDGSGCQPSWGGITPLTSGLIRGEVSAVRAAGADVIVSFGGQQGPDLSQVCRTPGELFGAYLAATALYHARRVDFDLEGGALDDAGGSWREIAAIGLLERWAHSHHHPLQVSLTVPVDPTGLEADVLRVLGIARARHVRIDIVNVMTMDFGDSLAPPGTNTMAGWSIQAVSDTRRQIAGAFPGGFRRLGVTVMIGVNDQSDEVFGLTDAATLAGFARAHGLGRLAMWSVARDRGCAHPGGGAQDECSGVAQAPEAFSRLLGGG